MAKLIYQYNDTITIECKIGYTLQGETSSTCKADETWSHSEPTCKSIYINYFIPEAKQIH